MDHRFKEHDIFHTTEDEEAPRVFASEGVLLKDFAEHIGYEISDEDWSAFIAKLGAYLLSRFKPRGVVLVLHALVESNLRDLSGLRDIYRKKKKDFKEDFDSCPKTILENVYSTFVEPEMPARSWLVAKGRQPIRGLQTPKHETSPSDFAKMNVKSPGIGYSVANKFDPSPNGVVFERLLPREGGGEKENIVANSLEKLSASRGLAPVGEKPSVQALYDILAGDFGLSRQNANVSYSFLGSPTPARTGGEMDGSIQMFNPYDANNRWALAVWENKGGEASTFVGTRQAGVGYGFGIATGLLGLGVEAKDIVVPIVVSTGITIQFGGVYVLQPSFPVYTHVSRVFDLEDRRDAVTAAAYVRRVQEAASICRKQIMENKPPSPPDLSGMEMLLDTGRYHLKFLTNPDPGLTDSAATADSECRHLFRIFNELHEKLSPADRSYVVFPFGLREPDLSAPEGDDSRHMVAIIFDNLCRDDYPGGPFKAGLPCPYDGDNVRTGLWHQWLVEVEHAFYVVHQAGIVHVDPYPSNVMWRCRDDSIEVRIIDWDAAHSVERDGVWAEAVKVKMQQLTTARQNLGWKSFGEVAADHDLQYLKVLRKLDPAEDREICERLGSNDISQINSGFREAAEKKDISNVDQTQLLGYKMS